MMLSWIFILLTSIFFVRVTSLAAKVSGPIEKPPFDKKEYRGVTLSNRLQVLLIHDENSAKSTVSLSIGVGSFNNPHDLPGLAHFVEHALFLGNKKYPEENGFIKYIGANGGTHGAFTLEEYGTYSFDVAQSALKGALDRFSQCLISPLFLESSLEKEINAIHSEHTDNVGNDSRRRLGVEKETANKSHVFSKFSTGNRETLWTNPKERGFNMSEKLGNFFKKFYSANIMRLAVSGPQTLDELQKTVESTFSAIQDTNAELSVWKENPYGPEQFQRRNLIVPISEIRTLRLTFSVPYLNSTVNMNAYLYVTSLLGQKGQGSLLSLLKKKNLATHIGAAVWTKRGFSQLMIEVLLTSEGLNKTENAVCLFFRYIDLLRNEGPQEKYWETIPHPGNAEKRMDVMSLLKLYSFRMLIFPLEKTITGGTFRGDFKASLISGMLNLITPQRIRMTVTSKTFESIANITEKFCGTKYVTEKIHPSVITMWEGCKRVSDLHLPKLNEHNELIAFKFKLKDRVEKAGNIPAVIKETPLSQVWFLQDSEFLLPMAIMSVEMYSPQAYADSLSVWLRHMTTEIWNDALTKLYEDATQAKLYFSISSSPYSIELKVEGFDEKLDVLIKKVFETLVNLNFSAVEQTRFESLRDAYRQKLENYKHEEPKESAITFLYFLLRDRYWSLDDLLSVKDEDITRDRVAQYAKKFFSRLKLQWIFYGNLLPIECLNILKETEFLFTHKYKTKPLRQSETLRFHDLEIPTGSDWIYQINSSSHSSNAFVLMHQLGSLKNSSEVVMAALLRKITHILFYDQLRTKEQLGYVVSTKTLTFEATMAFLFIVQGDHHPAYVNSRVKIFLSNFIKLLASMTKEDFKNHKNAYRDVLKDSEPKKMSERFNFIANVIASEQQDFNLEVTNEEALNNITLLEFRQFFNEYFGANGEKKKTILVNVVSVEEASERKNMLKADKKLATELSASRVPIGSDISKWKKQRSLYPIYKE